jgi:hypothetical protein
MGLPFDLIISNSCAMQKAAVLPIEFGKNRQIYEILRKEGQASPRGKRG